MHLSGLGEHLAHVECGLRLRMLLLQRPALRRQRALRLRRTGGNTCNTCNTCNACSTGVEERELLLLRRTGGNTCNTCNTCNACSTGVEERELLRVLAAELAQLLQHLHASASVSIR